MASTPSPLSTPAKKRRDFLILLACLLVVLGVLFNKSLLPEYILHNNDAPLGANAQSALKLPSGFTGVWLDLNWLGVPSLMPPDVSMTAQWILGPLLYAKLWEPLVLLILGLSAWTFCRAMKFSPAACVLGGLGVALHGDPFSNACWGQVSRAMCFASIFLSLAALQGGGAWRGWVRVGLAGMAVGSAIMEGFDVGALFSLLVAAYVLVQAWTTREGGPVKRVVWGGSRLALVAVCAALTSAATLTSLVSTQIKGVAGMAQDEESKAQRWNEATLWSIPKAEILTTFIPGIFGYRLDTLEGGQYWGKSGRDPAWDRYFESGMQGPPPRAMLRWGGVGNYAGQLTWVLGIWALLHSLGRKNSSFTEAQRKFIWFWAGAAFVCMLLLFGRFAPFYQFFYLLPYASTIRNPSKFVHLFDLCSMVLFCYGAEGLCRQLARHAAGTARGFGEQWKRWWPSASTFDRRWIIGSVIAVGAVLLGWIIYASSVSSLKKYLMDVQFDPASAAAIARFSIGQAGWFALFFTLTIVAVALVKTGYFSGVRARWAAVVLGAVLVADMWVAHRPWIIYWNYPQKYATNPVLERLREKPYEHRTIIVPEWLTGAFQLPAQAQAMEQYLNQLYRTEWAQHHFPKDDIQSLDVVQMPRPPQDYVVFEGVLQVRSGETLRLLTRRLELTNTRYLLGMAGFVDPLLNKQLDTGRERFRVVERFNIVPKPGVAQPSKLEELTAATSAEGAYALIEFTGALPRAKLYSNWQVAAADPDSLKQWLGGLKPQLPKESYMALAALGTNDQATLRELTSATFDPAQSVLISEPISAKPNSSTNQIARTVEIKQYEPKRIQLKASATGPTILLLNDRLAPDWQVSVDNQPARLLRCNFLMRGVQLPAGDHTVEFSYQPSTTSLYVSLGTIVVGFLCLGALLVPDRPIAQSQASRAQSPSKGR